MRGPHRFVDRSPLRTPALLLAALLVLLPAGCSDEPDQQQPAATVTVYTALDQVFSEPVLQAFEQETGIEVRPVYDTEASKTTGLINRLRARRDDPDCDVLWNNEIVQTVRLAQEGLLAPYRSPNADRFDAQFRDADARWTGFAGRLRVMIYNTDQVSEGEVAPELASFTNQMWRGNGVIARPFFGTTLTHFAVLYQKWGPERLQTFCRELKANDVALAEGNAVSRDMVAAGERVFGLTDTDDAHGAMLDGKPVDVAIPDGEALLIPNTVAMVKGCPHPEAAKKLIDYLLSPAVERELAAARSAQIPLGNDLDDVETPWDPMLDKAEVMTVDYARAAADIEKVVELLREEGMDQ
jgi:iron(III) transport system substrate-binding protein